jgi:hypothetical protein
MSLSALLMLLGPVLVFLVTLPFSQKLRSGLRRVYRFAGGFVVTCGPAVSLYFAMYSGDQGGIAAFFMQVLVIATYVLLCVLTVMIELYLRFTSAT